jgi:ribonuclease J
MRNGKVSWGNPVESGVVYVDGLSITDADPVVFRDRQKLASDGIVLVVATVSKRKREVGDVEISCRGVSFNADEIANDAQDTVKSLLTKQVSKDGVSIETLRKSARNSLSGFLWSKTRTRPMVIPVVMEV